MFAEGMSYLKQIPGCGTSSEARLRLPGGIPTDVVKKGGLVEYIGSQVNTFDYCGMSRTKKM